MIMQTGSQMLIGGAQCFGPASRFKVTRRQQTILDQPVVSFLVEDADYLDERSCLPEIVVIRYTYDLSTTAIDAALDEAIDETYRVTGIEQCEQLLAA